MAPTMVEWIQRYEQPLLWDLETNGLRDREDLRILCACAINLRTGEEFTFDDEHLDEFEELLSASDFTAGHNIAGFDYPVMQDLRGWAPVFPMIDTMIVSRGQFFSNLLRKTAIFRNRGTKNEAEREARFPKSLMARPHSLAAWGYRLKFLKGEFLSDHGVQEECSQQLIDYCLDDCRLNVLFLEWLFTHGAERGWPPWAPEAMLVESMVAWILEMQKSNGVGFDRAGAERLVEELAPERARILARLRGQVTPWYVRDGGKVTTPKRTARSRKVGPGEVGYRNVQAGCPYSKVKLIEFNPGSTQQIEDRLRRLYDWQPEDFTPSGLAKCDEDTLAPLPFPIIPDLMRYLMLNKRLGQIADGKNAWLKKESDGLIHGTVRVTGTRTTRMSHSDPNLGQVPKNKSPYGTECRALFHPTREGWVQLGCDASGLQLRMLANRMARYDAGAFGQEVCFGDPHSSWQAVTGLFYRENQKTLTYADLFGAGDGKRGLIVLADWREAFENGLTEVEPPPLRQARNIGKRVKARLMQQVSALAKVHGNCARAFRRGYVVGLDGRTAAVGAEHSVLADVLQCDEACVMKRAAVILQGKLDEARAVMGVDYGWMLNVHDEWQLETPPYVAPVLGPHVSASIKEAGEALGVRVPLGGDFAIGSNWSETH